LVPSGKDLGFAAAERSHSGGNVAGVLEDENEELIDGEHDGLLASRCSSWSGA
jgi:hypothetical protein